jgi:hypothetical protein
MERKRGRWNQSNLKKARKESKKAITMTKIIEEACLLIRLGVRTLLKVGLQECHARNRKNMLKLP